LGGHLILPCVKEALLPGDAIFFIGDRGQVDHTALYLGNQDLLHATGAEVKIQSLNPAATNYFKRFDGDFLGAKRFWW
jgi:cell wall-associated NlpC family hydrolase